MTCKKKINNRWIKGIISIYSKNLEIKMYQNLEEEQISILNLKTTNILFIYKEKKISTEGHCSKISDMRSGVEILCIEN